MDKKNVMAFKNFSATLNDGVAEDKAAALMPIFISYDLVRQALISHGYDVSSVPLGLGVLATMNKEEFEEFNRVLNKVEELGIKDIVQNNIGIRAMFREVMMARIEFCLKCNLPFVDQNGLLKMEMLGSIKFAEFTRNIPLENIPVAHETIEISKDASVDNDLEKLSDEEKQLYNAILKRVLEVLLANPTDEVLNKVVNNIKAKLVAAILNKEYEKFGIREMLENMMFVGVEVTPIDEMRITQLMDEAFPLEEERGAKR